MHAFRHLYVHIPFCRHKCGYCDFNAYAGMDRLMPDYAAALEQELVFAGERYPFQQLERVYSGGGTPSLLPAGEVSRLLEFIRRNFNIAPDAEVTLEANPASTDETKIGAWLEGGVNRLSLGVQGFDQRALAVLERKTDAAQAVRAFSLAREMGMSNVSIDLIYAVPFQSLKTWLETLRRAIALSPDHVSTYCLSFEEGTLLHRRRAEGKVPEVETDLQWDQLDAACAELEAAGFRRYEVSNWSHPGFESRHNHAYWRCRPVYGAGAGAHSYATDGISSRRWWNVARPRDYMAAGEPVADRGDLPPRKAAGEALMLGLPTTEGMAPPERVGPELPQPHPSGGRVPTAAACRYFVDFLMDLEAVPEKVGLFIREELRRAPADVQGMVEKVAMTLAAVTQNASVASAPHGTQARVKHVDLVSLEPTEVLLILLLEGNLLR